MLGGAAGGLMIGSRDRGRRLTGLMRLGGVWGWKGRPAIAREGLPGGVSSATNVNCRFGWRHAPVVVPQVVANDGMGLVHLGGKANTWRFPREVQRHVAGCQTPMHAISYTPTEADTREWSLQTFGYQNCFGIGKYQTWGPRCCYFHRRRPPPVLPQTVPQLLPPPHSHLSQVRRTPHPLSRRATHPPKTDSPGPECPCTPARGTSATWGVWTSAWQRSRMPASNQLPTPGPTARPRGIDTWR